MPGTPESDVREGAKAQGLELSRAAELEKAADKNETEIKKRNERSLCFLVGRSRQDYGVVTARALRRHCVARPTRDGGASSVPTVFLSLCLSVSLCLAWSASAVTRGQGVASAPVPSGATETG